MLQAMQEEEGGIFFSYLAAFVNQLQEIYKNYVEEGAPNLISGTLGLILRLRSQAESHSL